MNISPLAIERPKIINISTTFLILAVFSFITIPPAPITSINTVSFKINKTICNSNKIIFYSMNNKINIEFAKAYNEYAEMILKYIFFRVNDCNLAEDIMQETFLKMWDYIANKNKKIKDFKKFLYMVAKNMVIDHYRRKSKNPLPIDKISPLKLLVEARQEKETDELIQMEKFMEHLSELKENYKEVIKYRYIDQLSIKEICRLTGKSPNCISVTLNRGMKMIKKKINLKEVVY